MSSPNGGCFRLNGGNGGSKSLRSSGFFLQDLFSAFLSQFINSCHGQAPRLSKYFLEEKKIVINDVALCPPGEAFSQHLTHNQQVHNISISSGP